MYVKINASTPSGAVSATTGEEPEAAFEFNAAVKLSPVTETILCREGRNMAAIALALEEAAKKLRKEIKDNPAIYRNDGDFDVVAKGSDDDFGITVSGPGFR